MNKNNNDIKNIYSKLVDLSERIESDVFVDSVRNATVDRVLDELEPELSSECDTEMVIVSGFLLDQGFVPNSSSNKTTLALVVVKTALNLLKFQVNGRLLYQNLGQIDVSDSSPIPV